MSLNKSIKYGWCKTDHKSGRKIREDFPREDYVLDAEFRPFIEDTLASWGMNFPKFEEIFRGTSHDMLFVDSHGIILRIGYLDIEDLINPTILQPIGWRTTTETKYQGEKFTVAIYPGTEQLVDFVYNTEYRFEKSASNLVALSGQNNHELGPENIGVICVNSSKDNEEYAQFGIDIDNMYNSSKPEMREKRNEFIKANSSKFENKADLMSAIIHNLFNDKKELESNIKAFDVHQLLRRMFWECDKKCNLSNLFNVCADVLDNPTVATFPIWRQEKGIFVKSEITVDNMALYNTWSDAKPFVPSYIKQRNFI